jgi:hypothetical protein
MRRSSIWLLPLLWASLSLVACQTPGTTAPPPATSGLSPDLQNELNATQDTLSLSVQNNLNQARNNYFSLTGRLMTLDTDVPAFAEMVNQVLPALLGAANSLNTLTGDTADSLKADYRALFSDSVAAMLNGINTNLQLYQGFFEAPQSLGSSANSSATEALEALSGIFQASEYTERYIAELAQFQALTPTSESQQLLNGIQNQQSVLLSGVLSFSTQGASSEAVKQAYHTIVGSLTNPNFFNQLLRLAVAAFGESQVAYRQNQLTPSQSNPNAVVMVVQEDATTYRMINFENNQLTNRITQDSRGLSAADLLNQSTVVVMPSPRP